MVWMVVLVMWTWAEDFQTLPPGQTPPGWQVLYTYNIDHAGVVLDTCYHYLRPGSPGNPQGNLLLCMDHRHGFAGIDSSIVEIATPVIPLPPNLQGPPVLSFNWTVQAGTLRTFVRSYAAGTWSPWNAMDVRVDTGHTYGDTVYTHGSATLTLPLPSQAESLQVYFRFAHNPVQLYSRWVGATVDDLVITDSTPCCHLTIENFAVDSSYVDSSGTLWAHVTMWACFTDSTCADVDTFELTWIVGGDTVNQDTLILTFGQCVPYGFWFPAQYGSNTLVLYDNDCCTTPHTWTVVEKEEEIGRTPRQTPRVLVLRKHADFQIPFEGREFWVHTPTGRKLKASKERLLQVLQALPPGRVLLRSRSNRWVVILLP